VAAKGKKKFVGAWKVPDNFGNMTREEIDAWVDQMMPEIQAAFQKAKEPEAKPAEGK
jgi:hypothetical protein